jgi:hypothetical protein
MPRPRILCQQKKDDLFAMLFNGSTLAAAAKHVGCSVLTVRREARRNPQFAETLRRAEMVNDLNPVKTLRRAATSDWRAAAWLLERTQPQQYARRGPNTFSPDDVAELLDRVCEAIGEETGDAQVSKRIRRRALAMARSKSLHHEGRPFRSQLLAADTPQQQAPPEPEEVAIASDAQELSGDQPSNDNPYGCAPYRGVPGLYRLSDIPPRESTFHSPAHAS